MQMSQEPREPGANSQGSQEPRPRPEGLNVNSITPLHEHCGPQMAPTTIRPPSIEPDQEPLVSGLTKPPVTALATPTTTTWLARKPLLRVSPELHAMSYDRQDAIPTRLCQGCKP